MKTINCVVLVLCAGLVLTSCGRSARSTNTTTVTTTTTGQELSDLKAAFDAGALTEEEFEKKRQEILDRAPA